MSGDWARMGRMDVLGCWFRLIVIKLFRWNIYRNLVFNLCNSIAENSSNKKKSKKKNLRDEWENNEMVGFDDEKKKADEDEALQSR